MSDDRQTIDWRPRAGSWEEAVLTWNEQHELLAQKEVDAYCPQRSAGPYHVKARSASVGVGVTTGETAQR